MVFVRHYILLPFHSGDQELLLRPRIQNRCSALLVHRANRSACPTVSHSFLDRERTIHPGITALLIVPITSSSFFPLSSRKAWLKRLVVLLVQITVRTSTSQFARYNLLLRFRDQQLVSFQFKVSTSCRHRDRDPKMGVSCFHRSPAAERTPVVFITPVKPLLPLVFF